MNEPINWCGYNWEVSMEGGRLIHPDRPWMWYSKDCVTVDDDNQMHLSLKLDPTMIKYWDGTVYNPIMATGVIRSSEPFGCGTFSAEIKLPKGTYLWPSFWTTGCKTWPPEIDIMEAESEKGSYFHWTQPQFPWLCPNWKTTNNFHWNDVSDDDYVTHEQAGMRPVKWCKQHKNPSDNFIEYRCVWTPYDVSIYVGNKLVRQLKGDDAYKLYDNTSDRRMWVVMNLWCENPLVYDVKMETEMIIRKFEYTPLDDMSKVTK